VDDSPDEEDDGQRRRTRVQSKEGVDQAGLYQAHTLKIILHIFIDEVSNHKISKAPHFEVRILSKVECCMCWG